jgi:hypothetical protein
VQVPKGISLSNPSGRYAAHRTGAVRFAGPPCTGSPISEKSSPQQLSE